ncbi:MAG: hypothetical protein PHU72_02910 [Dethiosulfovibrio sp.]|nr:hypothetical protein [Dethiosulfovibrio sp.]
MRWGKSLFCSSILVCLASSTVWALSFSMDQDLKDDLVARGGPFYLSWGTYKDF